MGGDSGVDLQHPRRSLGNRHRANAQKFLKLAESDPQNEVQNLAWAEQSARQAVLHDFTHEANWTTLAQIKFNAGDSFGLKAVIADLFTILGRDPEQLAQLDTIDMLSHGQELLNAALDTDPLDPDAWWQCHSGNKLSEFENRMTRLDLSDPRANILFGRRLERIRPFDEEMFIRLVKRLLAHRPMNHEAWTELAKLHEKRGEFDESWLCFDQAQFHFPQLPVRDKFLERIVLQMDAAGEKWIAPNNNARSNFLQKMQTLAMRLSSESEPEQITSSQESKTDDEMKISQLLEDGEHAAAFFLARRLVANGEAWAQEWLEKAKSKLEI